MTAAEYREAIAELGLSQVGAAHFLHVDERTSRRWALGEKAVPYGVAMMLRTMLAHRISVRKVNSIMQRA